MAPAMEGVLVAVIVRVCNIVGDVTTVALGVVRALVTQIVLILV
jgi:hypothetical protein